MFSLTSLIKSHAFKISLMSRAIAFLFVEFDGLSWLELLEMSFFAHIALWFLMLFTVLIATVLGVFLTISVLEFIFQLFGFPVFAIVSTFISYCLLWFAFFGITSLFLAYSSTRFVQSILQTNLGLITTLFFHVAFIISSASSTVSLVLKTENKFPNSPILLWLIAVPFLVFFFALALKVDKTANWHYRQLITIVWSDWWN